MQELIDRLQSTAGITEEQAQKVIEAVKDFVKEKFPMLEGAVDNIFGQ
jgi:nucleoid DNA-binding protein